MRIYDPRYALRLCGSIVLSTIALIAVSGALFG